jgi:nucleoside-triphosphatase THEP1
MASRSLFTMKNMSDPEHGGNLIILSGPRAAGKTTFIQKTLDHLHNKSVDIAGILSLPVEEDGVKIAIDGLDLRSGQTRRLAIRNPGLSGDLATRQWLFEPRAMQWANGVLEISTPCDLLVVDELGVLEFERGQGWMAGLKALDGKQYTAAVVVIRPELLEEALKRWPNSLVMSVSRKKQPDLLAILRQLV